MIGDSEAYICAWCGPAFLITSRHTELVRRDFVEVPQPSRIERLCGACWRAYVDEFLGSDFEATLDAYAAEPAEN